ncbi:MAG TPA: response regulator transcription factor [Ignavibacteriaceae bacterium]|nr:response regulator transcription factor [Ignavibacteriaceae bacterium]
MSSKILLVDDERDIVEFLEYNLIREGFEVITAYDGIEALQKLNNNPDLIILDIMMPKMDGYDVCRRIRENKAYTDVPVIFLTAKGGEADEIKGLELGASDFIKKPVSPQKLIARVNSNLKKRSGDLKELPQVIKIGPLEINREQYKVYIDERESVFPRKEFELLYFLASNPGKVFSREALLKTVWGMDVFVVDRTVDVHIRKIREKLNNYSDLIETLKGVGYRFKSVE